MATDALLLIDFQAAFDNPAAGPRNNPDAERNALILLARWRETNRPIVHIQHSSTEPGSALGPDAPGHTFEQGFEPTQGRDTAEQVRQQRIHRHRTGNRA